MERFVYYIEQLDESLFCYNKQVLILNIVKKLKHITVERHYYTERIMIQIYMISLVSSNQKKKNNKRTIIIFTLTQT